jgi:hypothetical protein
LKAKFVQAHLSNEFRSLDYNKIKSQKIIFFPITFNGDIILELMPICFPTSHSRQMQGMDHKYDGHAWCKMKTSNIKNSFGLGATSAWGTYVTLTIFASISFALLCAKSKLDQ